MDDLISRAAAIAEFDECLQVLDSCIQELKELSDVDAVQVVRCCQCKHWECFGDAEDGDYDIGTCELYNQGFGAECFCSNGERKENDDNCGAKMDRDVPACGPDYCEI